MSKVKENMETELLKAKIEVLESKIPAAANKEAEYIERVKKYEANADKRRELQFQIEQNRLKLMAMYPKATQSDILILEAWQRRIEETKKTDPGYSARLQREYKQRINEINRRLS